MFCEGYATALSANKALQASRLRGSVVACFSAHNLQMLATTGVVLADNDESRTGERAAQATGRPYFMSPVVGEDFNDFTARVDTMTERKILDNVQRNYPSLTLLSVTQKIAPVEHYDQIVLLMEGEVLASGTHTELMHSCPEYVQIYDSQRSTQHYESVQA